MVKRCMNRVIFPNSFQGSMKERQLRPESRNGVPGAKIGKTCFQRSLGVSCGYDPLSGCQEQSPHRKNWLLALPHLSIPFSWHESSNRWCKTVLSALSTTRLCIGILKQTHFSSSRISMGPTPTYPTSGLLVGFQRKLKGRFCMEEFCHWWPDNSCCKCSVPGCMNYVARYAPNRARCLAVRFKKSK